MLDNLGTSHPFLLGSGGLAFAQAVPLLRFQGVCGRRRGVEGSEAGVWAWEGPAPWTVGWAAGAADPYSVRGTALGSKQQHVASKRGRSRAQTGLGSLGVPQPPAPAGRVFRLHLGISEPPLPPRGQPRHADASRGRCGSGGPGWGALL